MTYRTKQEIFDLAYNGLKSQEFKKSINLDFNKSCAYRGDNGLKCAIGHCIDDEDYKPRFENHSVKMPSIYRATKAIIDTDHIIFANELQKCHDDASSKEDMQARLLIFATENQLEVPKFT